MKIFVVYDNEKKEYFKAKAKVAWAAIGSAKNAAINHNWSFFTKPSGYTRISFKEQNRFEIKEIDVEEYFFMKYRLESLEK